jgi:type IV pilus assembly protein PilY1
MKTQHLNVTLAILAGAFAAAFSCGASAQTPTTATDDFTQPTDTNLWVTFDGACLTAGNGTASNIPPCVGLPYYAGQIQTGGNSGYLGGSTAPSSGATEIPDPAGSGALRMTNYYTQAGSIISSGTPFPSSQGLQVIFKTVTYGGDKGGAGGDGADGIGFFLMDGGYNPYDTGAFGGSLGYTCSNVNLDAHLRADGTPRQYDGLAHGYLGLGIDEYGNFLNSGDNTASGDTNLAGTGQYQPGRIGLRGAGSIAWGPLSNNYPAQYPSTLTLAQQASAVKNTCTTGFLWDYSNAASPFQTTTAIADYAAVPGAYTILSSLLPGKLIANETATTRSQATPITYNLKITQNGFLSLYISYNGATYLPVITKQPITALGATMPASFRFGFTGSTGGSTNIHEILCFQASPAEQAGTSVGVNQQEATKVASGTQAYLAYYYPGTWTGRLTASNLLYNASTQTLSIQAQANWDASCNLTGIPAGAANACPTTGVVGPVPAQTPWYPGTVANPSRQMLTWNGSSGVAFEWSNATAGTAVTSGQQTTLDLGDTTPINANRLNYLRGDRTNEIVPAGTGIFRARDGILGDIIDSSPTWVGPPTSPYSQHWKDLILSGDPTPENTGTQSYTQYLATEQTRLNVVYNGANDGFLHGFRSGSFDVNGNFVNNATTPNDGLEVLAYMPGAVVQTIHNSVDPTQDYSNPQYSHNFYVDATPDVDELFYNGMWHTWLVGGLGAGGAAIYALDVTNPTNFSEANANTVVMGEWTPTLSCVGNATCGINMGNTYGTPVVRRLHDGNWGIIFGNGFGSATGDAGIFIMLINGSTGAVSSTYYLSTGKGTGSVTTPCTTGCDGIAYVSPADLDGDHITDYVYAGDLKGNVWRFDLTSGTETSWKVTGSPTPLFTVPTGAPITTRLQLAIIPATPTSAQRLMVAFGTGQKTPATNLTPATYLTGSQSLYGIWDWNMAAWNAQMSQQFASLASATVSIANLEVQTLTYNSSDATLDVTSNPVCWSGSTTCAGGPTSNTEFGWVVALLGANEQVVFNPLMYQNTFIVNTTIPAVSSPTSCQVSTDTGNTIALSLATGGVSTTTSGSTTSNFFKNTTDTNAAGSLTNGTGTPFIALAGGNAYLLTQSLTGGASPPPGGGPGPPLNCQGGSTLYCTGGLNQTGPTGKRLTWIERR